MHKQREERMTEARPRLRPRVTKPGGLHHTILALCKLMIHQQGKWTPEEVAEHEDDIAACELFCSPLREGEEV